MAQQPNGDFANPDQSGQGGSMARFAITNNTLYTIDQQKISIFDISEAENPTLRGFKDVGFGIETIFPKGNNLFIGSQVGMYIYDISQEDNPIFLSVYEHILSCDPVVADDQYAYVTQRSGTWCGQQNILDIVNIENLSDPILVRSYPMDHPKGLGIQGDVLFLCDDVHLKVFDVSDRESIFLKQEFDLEAFDVIPYNNLLMVTAEEGFYQYVYQDDSLKYLSHIPKTTLDSLSI